MMSVIIVMMSILATVTSFMIDTVSMNASIIVVVCHCWPCTVCIVLINGLLFVCCVLACFWYVSINTSITGCTMMYVVSVAIVMTIGTILSIIRIGMIDTFAIVHHYVLILATRTISGAIVVAAVVVICVGLALAVVFVVSCVLRSLLLLFFFITIVVAFVVFAPILVFVVVDVVINDVVALAAVDLIVVIAADAAKVSVSLGLA